MSEEKKIAEEKEPKPEVEKQTTDKPDTKKEEEPIVAPVADEEKIKEQEAEAKRQAEEEALAAEEATIQSLRPGMTIRIHQKIKEEAKKGDKEGDKERIQIFQGIILALNGKTPVTKTVTVMKKSFGVMVEKIFPLASPMIAKIEVVKIAKVRHAKLYFLREYTKRLKETL